MLLPVAPLSRRGDNQIPAPLTPRAIFSSQRLPCPGISRGLILLICPAFCSRFVDLEELLDHVTTAKLTARWDIEEVAESDFMKV